MNFSNPKKIISQVSISKGSAVADFGFGTGEFLRFLSREVGDEGQVYALDIQPDIVRKVSGEFEESDITNTHFLAVDLEKENSTGISNGHLDFILISSVFFQSEKKENILEEAFRILRPLGRILFIDWKESFSGIGPSKEKIFNENSAVKMFENFSLDLENRIDVGDYHYGLLYRKK